MIMKVETPSYTWQKLPAFFSILEEVSVDVNFCLNLFICHIYYERAP